MHISKFKNEELEKIFGSKHMPMIYCLSSYQLGSLKICQNLSRIAFKSWWHMNTQIHTHTHSFCILIPTCYAMLCYAKSLQPCPTLCDPIDSSLPGSPVPGILQARTLEWVAISFSNAWKWKVKAKSPSRVRLLATLWTAAYQTPLSMGFSRQEYWVGCHCLLRSSL